MAELLAAGGVVDPDSVADYLRDVLPDDHIVVADPVVARCPLDAVVVGPGGVIALRAVDWSVVARPSEDARPASRVKVRDRDLAASARKAIGAVRTFMQDEFPSLDPAVRHLHVVRDPDAESTIWRVLQAPRLREETLEETLMSSQFPLDENLASEETREAVAVALRDRELTVSQRASKPFVFRSGRLLGIGSKVWTIRDAVKYMDRHPADGIYHLRNGTLAEWLDEEGAPHLAELARSALVEARSDHRMALEIFLAGTGLISRPPVKIRPKRVDLGYILEGDTGVRSLQVRRGRGYLFGELETSEPWLQVEPKTFRGEPVNGLVTATTRSLLIRPEPYRAEVSVKAGATSEPATIPVRLRVVAMPSPWVRYLLRPLTGLLLGGALGAAVGWLWGLAGVVPPAILTGWNPIGPHSAWITTIGVAWAVLGVIWGILLPPTWPTRYAAGRWLVRIGVWAAVLALLAVATLWYWSLRSGTALSGLGPRFVQVALYGVAAAIVPAVLTEAVAGRRRDGRRPVERRRLVGRLALLVIAVAVLLALLTFGPRVVGPAWQRLEAQGISATGQRWIEDGWEQLNTTMDELLDWFYLRYYDRRAPSQPTPSASPTSVSTGTPAIR